MNAKFAPPPSLYTVGKDGKIQYHFHPAQLAAWNSTKRQVAVFAGTQGGKTTFGPPWMLREIQTYGPGDYMIVGPTLRLLEKKTIPEFRRFFEKTMHLGEYRGIPSYEFTFNEEGSVRLFGEYDELNPTRVMFGYADNPDSLESATAKGIWCDESGQDKFREGSLDALFRRGSIYEARILHTTTLYNFGWLKRRIYDPWKASNLIASPVIRFDKEGETLYYQLEKRDHPDIDIIRFESVLNPAFTLREFRRAKRDLPPWKFGLFYEGRFTRPAGQIYDCFDETVHVIKRFTIPDQWERYLGLDFGGTNTGGVFLARDPNTDTYYVYRTYHSGNRTSAEHVEQLLRNSSTKPVAYGGAPSENQWRSEFSAAGLPVARPLFQGADSVEVGIAKVYSALSENKLKIFSDCTGLIDEFISYSHELDDNNEPTNVIADKHNYHLLDALRYIMGGWIRRSISDIKVPPIQLLYGSQKDVRFSIDPLSR